MKDIFKAAYENDVDSLACSIRSGIDVNAQHPRAGTLPLQLACQGDALDSIRYLLAHGADPRRQFTRTSRVDGRVFRDHRALMYAKSVEAAKLLLDSGAELDVKDEYGNTPLVWAIYGGNIELVRYYLARGATTSLEIEHDGERLSLEQFISTRIEHFRMLANERTIAEIEFLTNARNEIEKSRSSSRSSDHAKSK